MIDDVLIFLKKQLNGYFAALSGSSLDGGQEERVVFPDTTNVDPMKFKSEAVTVLLLNIEQEKLMRAADLYSRVNSAGVTESVNPEIHLNLYVMFVANAKQYDRSLKYLSNVVKYFHSHRVFDSSNSSGMKDSITQLVVELMTLPLSEQNDIWSSLRTSNHPSVLYKVKMVIYQDEVGVERPSIEQVESSAANMASRVGVR